MTADAERATFLCIDCSCDTLDGQEYYMLTDATWAKTGLGPSGGMLCIGCCEKRIKRRLIAADFPNYPINFIFPSSALLRARKASIS